MASETNTTTAGEFSATEVISSVVKEAAYSFGKVMPVVFTQDLRSAPTNRLEVAKWPLLTAVAQSEGVDMVNTAINPTSLTADCVENGLMITVTDFLANSDIHGGLEPYARQIAKAVAAKADTDLLAEAADYSTTVGSTGVNMTETNALEVIYNLENGNCDTSNGVIAVVHPIQLHDLRVDCATTAGAIWGAQAGGPESLVRNLASFYGVTYITSTNAASVNGDADRQGFAGPLNEQMGITLGVKVDPYVEFDRDISMRGTEAVAIFTYADENMNVAANGGLKIVTDHE